MITEMKTIPVTRIKMVIMRRMKMRLFKMIDPCNKDGKYHFLICIASCSTVCSSEKDSIVTFCGLQIYNVHYTDYYQDI